MDWGVYTGLADEKVVIYYGNMILSQLNIYIDLAVCFPNDDSASSIPNYVVSAKASQLRSIIDTYLDIGSP